MKRTPYCYIINFALLSWMSLLTQISIASSSDAESYLSELKAHYQSFPTFSVFSIDQDYLQASPYQGWDFKSPNRWTASKVTEFDLENRLYYENVIHHFTGGLRYDEVHFQSKTTSLRYEKNGLVLGRRILSQSMGSFERYRNLYLANIDFLAVKPLLNEQDVGQRIELEQGDKAGLTRLVHQAEDGKVLAYTFSAGPIQLVSIEDRTRNRISYYSDYQTTAGLTYARSIVKYYDGESEPRFIKRINRLDILKEISTDRFILPNGYGPVIERGDRVLTANEIVKDLYLITDSSARYNTLFKVTDDEILVYGGATSLSFAEKILTLIAEKFPGKHIKGIYVTHPHSDHIDGLAAFVKRGIAVYADTYSIAAIKAYPAFDSTIDTFSFRTVSHKQLLNGVRFYVLENAHAKRQSFAYFEDSGVLYQADFLDVALDNTLASVYPTYAKTFIDFVHEEGLDISRIVGQNANNNIDPDILDAIYKASSM